jgi:hypothetical protein
VDVQRRAGLGSRHPERSCPEKEARLETPFGSVVGTLPCAVNSARSVIGRSADTAIRLTDMFVQPEHACVWWDESSGTHMIEDLASGYGTYVDGHRVIATRTLFDGNAISVGKTVLIYRLDPSARRPSSSREEDPGFHAT